MKKRLYVDMDGVLAQFNPDATLEELHRPGYYGNLKPMDNVVQAVNMIAEKENDIEVYILSKVLKPEHIKKEKSRWLDKYLPSIPKENRVFCDYGISKAEVVKAGKEDVLLDDFSPNLHEWRGRGIKLFNGINGNHGTWHGYGVYSNTYPEMLAKQIKTLVMYG